MNLQEIFCKCLTQTQIQTPANNQSILCHSHLSGVFILLTLLSKIHYCFPLPIIRLVVYQILEYQKRHFTEKLHALKDIKQNLLQLLLLWLAGLIPSMNGCDNRQITIYRL